MDVYQIEITNRERAVILIALGMLAAVVQNGGARNDSTPEIPTPTLDEIRDIAGGLWPDGDMASLRNPS
jgi:hypothetical protein